ncbi:MAG: ABC transporter permease [Solirubrobacterales bacterium]
MTAYLRLEVVRQFRNRDALAWRLGLPAGLYVFFRAVFGAGDGTSEGLPSDLTATVIFAVFGALAAGLYSTAPALAQERATGWLRQLRATPLPASATVVSKIAAAMAYALPAIALVAVAAAATQGVELGLGRWVELTLLVWVATLPFAALGVLIGLAIPNAEPAQSAASAAMIVLWVLGGMLTSPSDLPGALETVAHALPTNAAAELGWAAARADPIPASAVAVVVAWTAGLGALAGLAWPRVGAAR